MDNIKNYKYKTLTRLYEDIRNNVTINAINCEKAHNISIKFSVSPKIVGNCINTLNVKLEGCQLGLFGCNNTNKLSNKIQSDAKLQLIKCILEIKNDNRLDCKSIWYISKKLNLKKTYIGSICKILEIKISGCQLGLF